MSNNKIQLLSAFVGALTLIVVMISNPFVTRLFDRRFPPQAHPVEITNFMQIVDVFGIGELAKTYYFEGHSNEYMFHFQSNGGIVSGGTHENPNVTWRITDGHFGRILPQMSHLPNLHFRHAGWIFNGHVYPYTARLYDVKRSISSDTTEFELVALWRLVGSEN